MTTPPASPGFDYAQGSLPGQAGQHGNAFSPYLLNQGVRDWLPAFSGVADASVITLGVGINDLWNKPATSGSAFENDAYSAFARYVGLVDDLHHRNPDAPIILAELSLMTPGWTAEGTDANDIFHINTQVEAFNRELAELVNSRKYLFLADVEGELARQQITQNLARDSFYTDGLHYNDAGQAAAARAYFRALDNAFRPITIPIPTPGALLAGALGLAYVALRRRA